MVCRKVGGDLWDKTGGTLCHSLERVCRMVVATMVLHNICIDHSLQLETDITAEDDIIEPHDTNTHSGDMVRQSVITDCSISIKTV